MSSPIIPPICTMCAHWQPGMTQPDGRSRCIAFPDGIPEEYGKGLGDHRTVDPRQQGTTTFEPNTEWGVDEEMLEVWNRTREDLLAGDMADDLGLDLEEA